MTKTIKCKFDIGDRFYFVDMEKRPIHHGCPFCGGHGKLLQMDNNVVECPKCNGTGNVTTGGGLEQVVKKDKVVRIKINIDKHTEVIEYFGELNSYYESSVFDTEVKAKHHFAKGIMGYTS